MIYTCLPLFHGNAYNYSCYPALWADAELAISERFSVSRFWPEIREARATEFNALGAMISLLLKQPPSLDDRSHSVRQCMALPLSRETYRTFRSRFGMEVTFSLRDDRDLSGHAVWPEIWRRRERRLASRQNMPICKSWTKTTCLRRLGRLEKSASGPANPGS